MALPGSTAHHLPFENLDESKAREYLDSKFWGQFWAAYEARRHVRRGGSIVLFSGCANRRPVPGYVVGAGVDGALDGLTRSLAWELSAYGIRVNCVSPGVILTEIITRGMSEAELERFLDSQARRVPLGRVGRPEECARGAIYLMTNRFVTGEVLAIDGGFEAGA